MADQVEGCDVLPEGSPLGLLHSPHCKETVTNNHPKMAVNLKGPFPGKYIKLLRNHAFSVASVEK
jgi:hypothetical protein